MVRYLCEVCNSEHTTESAALSCESREPLKIEGIKVGDIVTTGGGYGWYKGDDKWIANPDVELGGIGGSHKQCPNGNGNCFANCCTYQFYYVVTAITAHRHKLYYHCKTKALPEAYGGRTSVDGTKITKVVKPPAYVVEESKSLIGSKCHLDSWL